MRLRIVIGLVVALVLLVCNPVRGQDITEIAGPFGLPVSGADLERMSKMLNLDGEQRQVAKQLYQGYRGSLRQTMQSTNDALKAMEGTDPSERANRGMEVLDQFADKHEAVERGFFDDLTVVLRPEQRPALESVHRMRRREVQMRFAFAAGEGVDLIAVLDRLGATPAAGTEAAGVVADYEETIDRLMVEKQRLLRSSLRRAFKLQKGGMPDFELIGSIVGDLYALGCRIRDTNKRYIRLLEPLLSEEKRVKLVREVRHLSYPRVYADTLANKMLVEARELAGLSPEQAEELRNLEASYSRDLEAANQRYAAAIDSTQERFPKDFLAVMQLRNSDNPDDPLVKARREREELNQRVYARLRAVLKAADFEKLPQIESERDRGPEFLPNFRVKKEMGEVIQESEDQGGDGRDPDRKVEPR